MLHIRKLVGGFESAAQLGPLPKARLYCISYVTHFQYACRRLRELFAYSFAYFFRLVQWIAARPLPAASRGLDNITTQTLHRK